MRHVHTIPVPAGWSIEQAWEAISRGQTVPEGASTWANIEVDPDRGDRLIRVLPSLPQIRERATDLAKAAGVASELDELTERLAGEACEQAAARGRTLNADEMCRLMLDAMQQAVGDILDGADPTPAA